MKTRRIVQITLLLTFIYLIILTAYPFSPFVPAQLFLKLDPASYLLSALASRDLSLLLFMIPALLTACLFGRVFCGWICPLGTLIDISDHLITPRRRLQNRPEAAHPQQNVKQRILHPRTKYLILIAFLVAGALGVQSIWLMDPIPALTRTVITGIVPAVEWIIHTVFNWMYVIPKVNQLSEPVYSFLKDHFLSFQQPYFHGHPIAIALAIAVLLLSLLGRRVWCRNLCPLGAFLSFIAKASPLRINRNPECIHCRKCALGCKMGAIAEEPKSEQIDAQYLPAVDSSECILCGSCWTICPTNALKAEFKNRHPQRPHQASLERRQVLRAIAAGVFVAPLMRLHPSKGHESSVTLIRPPGALPKDLFLDKCIRCGECMKVCPQNAIHPAILEAGIQGLFSPRLIPRIGYCEYQCNLCGQVCPTGALQQLTLKEKKRTALGLAQFVKDRCLPHAQGVNCLVCEEHCPTAPKAIQFRVEQLFIPHTGETNEILRPYVVAERCIGCGTCENVCPLEGTPGIRVHPYANQKMVDETDAAIPLNPYG